MYVCVSQKAIRITEQDFGVRLHFTQLPQLVRRVSLRALREPQSQRQADNYADDENEHPCHGLHDPGAAVTQAAGLDGSPRPTRREALCAVRTGVPRTMRSYVGS